MIQTDDTSVVFHDSYSTTLPRSLIEEGDVIQLMFWTLC